MLSTHSRMEGGAGISSSCTVEEGGASYTLAKGPAECACDHTIGMCGGGTARHPILPNIVKYWEAQLQQNCVTPLLLLQQNC